jgi:predicted kinase
MSARVVYIMRGVPGAGKSTLAATLVPGDSHVFSADNYFVQPDGSYKWDKSKLDAAHKQCIAELEDACVAGMGPLVVDNTHTRRSEMTAALQVAERYGYEVRVLELLPPVTGQKFNEYVTACAARNVHGVPRESIERMALRLVREA